MEIAISTPNVPDQVSPRSHAPRVNVLCAALRRARGQSKKFFRHVPEFVASPKRFSRPLLPCVYLSEA